MGKNSVTFRLPRFDSSVFSETESPVVVHIGSQDKSLQIFCGFDRRRNLIVNRKQAVIMGQFLEIEHIYGLTENSSCLICLQNPVTVALAPCRHACLCDSCAPDFARAHNTACPVCRAQATGILRLSVVDPPQE